MFSKKQILTPLLDILLYTPKPRSGGSKHFKIGFDILEGGRRRKEYS